MVADTKKFISLAEAASQTPYSQEYLSLRARQKKLRAVRRGRNWMTTEEWVNDYIKNYASDIRPKQAFQQSAGAANSPITKISASQKKAELSAGGNFPNNKRDFFVSDFSFSALVTRKVLGSLSALLIGAVMIFSFANPSFGAELKDGLGQVWNNLDKMSRSVIAVSDAIAERKIVFEAVDFGPLAKTLIMPAEPLATVLDNFVAAADVLLKSGEAIPASFAGVADFVKAVSGDLALEAKIGNRDFDKQIALEKKRFNEIKNSYKDSILNIKGAFVEAVGNMSEDVSAIALNFTDQSSPTSRNLSGETASLFSVLTNLGKNLTSDMGDLYIKYVGWGVPDYQLAIGESLPLRPAPIKMPEPKIEIKELVRVTQILPKEETTRIITQEKEVVPSAKLASTDAAVNNLQSSVNLLNTRFAQMDSRLTTEEQKPGGTVINNYLTGDYLSSSGGTLSGGLNVMGNIIGGRLANQENLYLTSTGGNVVMSAGSSIDITGKKITLDATDSNEPLITLKDPTTFQLAVTFQDLITQTGGKQITLSGNVDAQNGLDVTGANFTVGGTKLTIDPATGNLVTAGNLTVSGNTSITGNAAITGTLTMTGGTTLGSTTASTLVITGNATLGDATSDELSITSRLVSSFLPKLDANVDLGSSALRFNNIYALTINTAGTNTSSQATFTLDPANTNITSSSVFINPTTADSNEPLLGIGLAGSERFRVDVEGDVSFVGSGTFGNASIDTLTLNAATITSASPTTWALANITDALNFDSNTLSIDALNNRVGIGTTTPTAALHLKAGTAAANTAPLKFTSGTLLTAPEAGAIEFLTDDFYGTITTGAARKKFYIEGGTDVALADGGTAASLTASTGGIVYSGASAMAILAGTATANKVLMSGASAAPIWSTPTYPSASGSAGTVLRADGTNNIYSTFTIPDTMAINTILYASSANVISALATANSGVLVTGATGIPSIATDIPTAVTIGGQYVYRVGGTDVAVADGGTGVGSWTNGQLLIGNTTGNTAALGTLTGTANQITVTNGAGSITLSTPQDIHTGASPAFAGLTSPTITGGSGTTQTLTYKTTTGVGATGADHIFQVGSNGATEAMRIINSGNVGIGATGPDAKLDVLATSGSQLRLTYTDGSVYSDFTVNSSGDLTIAPSGGDTTITGTLTTSSTLTTQGNLSIQGNTTLGDSSTDTITLNAATITSASPTTWALANVADALNFDSGTLSIDALNNRVGIGTTSPTAVLHLKAGTAAASTAPLKFNSGALLTAAEAGAIEFLTDDFYGTITTGAARKKFYIEGGTDVAVADGGTGVGSWTNGQLLIGNTTGNTAALGTLAGTANQVVVTNGASLITLSLPQSIATASTPQFARLGLGGAAHATDILTITSTDTTADSKALNIAHSGAITGTGYGLYVSKTGASTANVGGYFSATGATNNYGLIVENGNVGIGTTTPGAKLQVTGNGLFTSTLNLGSIGGGGGTRGTLSFGGVNGVADSFTINNTEGNYLKFQANSMSSAYFVMNNAGNVGIGTTSPAYKLHVLGDVAAQSFVNISTSEMKKDITYITDAENEDILNKIKSINIARYRYLNEDESNPLRLGLIAEEAPAEILSASGKGVDIYKLSTFALAGIQALAQDIEELAQKLTVSENLATGALEIQQLNSRGLRFSGGQTLFVNNDGYIEIDTLEVTQLKIKGGGGVTLAAGSDEISGSGLILNNTQETTVANANIVEGAKVFITFEGNPGASWWVERSTAATYFTVKLAAQASQDLRFQWLILKTNEMETLNNAGESQDLNISTSTSSSGDTLTTGGASGDTTTLTGSSGDTAVITVSSATGDTTTISSSADTLTTGSSSP